MGHSEKGFSEMGSNGFSVNDIKLGQAYEGYVKLMYNYGIFVTVKGVEGLLHKNRIAPIGEGIDWKKYYNIGDKIRVTAKEFKDIDGEKRVVWSQL
ncbi:MAG: S1 RNA-binding domain-containing protein [Candidatus Peribacteria bacterium]|jgi:ribosomal protein S1|nr:S1 RNA-binding domain-containing protein [Candidatus Peribacteria bacterium]